MAWIESHTLLLRHRKLVELAKALRLKPVHCLGHLHALWHAAMEQAENGDLSSWTDEFIAESASYQGDAHKFVSLLELHGWLDGKKIHDWLDYAGRFLHGKYSGKKERLVEIWAKHGRVYGETANKPPSNRQVTAKLPPSTLPNQTKPNQTKVKSVGAKFAPPTPQDVVDYGRSIGFDVDGEHFCAFYEARGWMLNGRKMKSWRAAVVTWKKRSELNGHRNGRIVGAAAPEPGKYAHLDA